MYVQSIKCADIWDIDMTKITEIFHDIHYMAPLSHVILIQY